MLTIFLSNKIVVLSQILHGRLSIAYDIHIVTHKIHVNIIDSGVINIFVLVVAFAFVVEKLHTLIKIEFLAFVAYTHETFVCLVGMKLNACRNVYKQDAVLSTFIVCTWQIFTPNPYRRIAEVERNAKQLIQSLFVSINPLYSASLVGNTNGKHTTIG